MNIRKVIETVFLKEWNTIAHILEDDVVVCLFNNVFMTESECFNHINEYCKGWVQATESCRKAILEGKDNVPFDYLKPYENLYNELKKYKNDLQIN